MEYLNVYTKKTIYCIVSLFFLICLTAKGENSVNILFLSSFEKGIPASVCLEKGISKTFEATPRKENLFFEYMNSQKLNLNSYFFYSHYLKNKYSNRKFDYIICWGFDSVSLLSSHRDIFPDSKRVFLQGSKKFARDDLLLEEDMLIKAVPDYSTAVKDVLKLKEIDKIFIIGTSSKPNQPKINILKKIISESDKKIEVEYLLDKNIHEISEKLSNKNDSAIAFYILMHSDGFGKEMTPYQVSEIICKNSSIPVFSFWENLLGSGISGGNLISFEVIGEKVGRLLFSDDSDVIHKEISPMTTVYDYNSLKKWGINMNKIPPSAKIVNKPPNFFVKYKLGITIFILSFSSITIISFLTYKQNLMKKKNKQLNVISEIDPLTGLKNRRGMNKIVKNELSTIPKSIKTTSILLIDVDYFKTINDSYGHNTGDIVLSEISKLLSENIRTSDSLSRWGGEEFLILSPCTDLNNAFSFAEKIRTRIENFNFTKAGKLTVSIGVAEHQAGETFDQLYERVDIALYSAKNKGKNRVEFSDNYQDNS